MKVEIRATAAFLRCLDDLAVARGMNRSEAIRAAVVEASPDPLAENLPPAPGRDELLRLLGEAARGGSVRAICLLLEELHRGSGDDDPLDLDGDSLSWVDALAAERRT